MCMGGCGGVRVCVSVLHEHAHVCTCEWANIISRPNY